MSSLSVRIFTTAWRSSGATEVMVARLGRWKVLSLSGVGVVLLGRLLSLGTSREDVGVVCGCCPAVVVGFGDGGGDGACWGPFERAGKSNVDVELPEWDGKERGGFTRRWLGSCCRMRVT